MKSSTGSRVARLTWGGLILVILAWLGVATYFALGPDHDVRMVRDMPTPLPPATIAQSIHYLSNWKDWHRSTKTVRRVDFRGEALPVADQHAENGEILRLTVDPKGQDWKRFFLKFQVTEYVMGRKIAMKLIEDSKGKLPRLLQDLRWSIEVLPLAESGVDPHFWDKQPPERKPQTILRATIEGRTNNWRARLFSGVAERIMLNQVFYPDLQALGKLGQPKGLVMPDDEVGPGAARGQPIPSGM